MKCSKCNQEIEETSAFCPFCGAPVEKEEKTQQEEQDESIVQEETDTKEETQPASDEPKEEVKVEEKEVVKEKTKEVVKENTKTEVKKETENKEDNKKASDSQNKKRHSVITMIVLGAVIVALIAIIILVVVFSSKGPDSLYKDFIKSALSDLYAGDLNTASSANINATVETATTIEELKEALEGLKVNINTQYDSASKQMILGLNVDKNSDSYLNLKALMDINNKAMYLSESNLYDKLIKYDIPEENLEILNEAFENTASVDKSAQKKAAVKIADAINNNLTEDMFAKQNVTVNINGEDKNVKDNTLTLSLEQFKTVFSNAISTLKLDEDFLNLYVDREQITASLDTLAESLDSISDLEGNVTIHYYTSGITNKFVGVAVVLEDAQQMEFVFELINTDKNLYESNLKVANYNGETQDILNATITINKSTNTEKDMLISVNIPQSGTIDFKILVSEVYNSGIETIDTANSVSSEELTDEDLETISENYENSKLYEVLSDYGIDMGSSLNPGTDTSSEREVPKGITLEPGQSFVQSYEDDTVIFEVPNSIEEEYAGLSYQSFSKELNNRATAYIDVNVDWYTLDEYEDNIASLSEYYTEEDEYFDVSVSDREEVEIAGRTYYKKDFTYSYGSGSYTYTSKQTYYYLPITDEYIYSVEVSDDDGIVTNSDIEKLLTIDIILH